MESLIVASLIILIMLLIVVVFVPAYLEHLARRNSARRDEYGVKSRELEREVRRYERALAPYARTRATIFRDRAAQVENQLSIFSEQVGKMSIVISQLRCPEIYDYLFPAQHFILHPEHIGAIASDVHRLKAITTAMSQATKSEAAVREALELLTAVAETLASNRLELTERLNALEAAVSQERADGIEALDDFSRDGIAIRQLLEETERSTRPGAILADLDGGALALQSAESTLGEAESRLVELQREKTALDRRLRRVATELDSLQKASKSGPAAADLPQVRPLTRRAAALLNEGAQGHRRRREFNAAGADVSTAAQLVNFGRDLNNTEIQIRGLTERDDGSSLSEAITALRHDLDGLLSQLESGQGGQSMFSDTSMASRAAQLRTRADTLIRRQDEQIAALSREATETRDNLSAAWEKGQAMLRLSEDDPLARRYNRLLSQFEEAQGKPAMLEQFRRDAQSFEGIWEQWIRRVKDTGDRINRLRSDLLGLIDEALVLVEPWNCLVEDVTFIQQRAAEFERLRAKFAAVNFRREAESIMDQLETIDADIEARYAQLKDRARRLQFLESDVNQIISLVNNENVELSSDDPQKARWERTLRLVDHHIRSAHAALHYEDASVSLLRAVDVANKQAV